MLKTPKQIEDEIKLSHGFKKVYLFTALRYIETNPKESFVISEIKRINVFIEAKKKSIRGLLRKQSN